MVSSFFSDGTAISTCVTDVSATVRVETASVTRLDTATVADTAWSGQNSGTEAESRGTAFQAGLAPASTHSATPEGETASARTPPAKTNEATIAVTNLQTFVRGLPACGFPLSVFPVAMIFYLSLRVAVPFFLPTMRMDETSKPWGRSAESRQSQMP